MPLNPLLNTSIILNYILNILELRNIKYIYLLRPKVTIIFNISLVVLVNKIIALVNIFSLGKSTIVNLVKRFYNPIKG